MPTIKIKHWLFVWGLLLLAGQLDVTHTPACVGEHRDQGDEEREFLHGMMPLGSLKAARSWRRAISRLTSLQPPPSAW